MSEDRATLSEELPDWPSLYDKTGNILDVNTLLVNVGELRAAFRTAVEAAILKEREACARIAEMKNAPLRPNSSIGHIAAEECARSIAAAIRARTP